MGRSTASVRDGTRISFSTLGGGDQTPAINVLSWAGVQEWQWGSHRSRAVDWTLAQDRCVVLFRLARRGRPAAKREDLSLEAHVADLRAVAEQLEFEHFDLFGGRTAREALAYAAGYPGSSPPSGVMEPIRARRRHHRRGPSAWLWS
jgi:hypothetical protein